MSLKRLLSILFALFLLSLNSRADSVSRERAQSIADAFSAKTRVENAGLSCQWDSRDIFSTRSSSDATFYVFSAENAFVIVSGEDSVNPILAYSFTNPMASPENLPEPVMDWLTSVSSMIEDFRLQEKKADAGIEALWADASVITKGDDELTLVTASWGQRAPYNEQCPYDNGKQCITGCVATAVGIAMYYHKWPERGKGTTEAYITDRGIKVPARDLNHEYDWDNMISNYSSGSYTPKQADAVATLLADLGHSFMANYGVNATSAGIQRRVLYENFDYNPGLYEATREYYSDEEWNGLIRNEIISNRPVIYRGSGDGGGHMFIVNGIKDEYFHINWGWGGSSDGYFLFDNLLDYNYQQSAVIDFCPNDGRKVSNWIKMYDPGLISYTSDFSSSRPFLVEGIFGNNTAAEFTGKIRLALVDKNGEIKEWISEDSEIHIPSQHSIFLYIDCEITVDIRVGDRIRAFYQSELYEEWEMVVPSGSYSIWELPVADEYTIEESTSVRFDRKEGLLTIRFKNGVAASLILGGIPVSEGVSLSGNEMQIDTQSLKGKTFVVSLEKGYEKVDIEFVINEL